MLSIFSCIYWPSVCLLWRNVYLGPLHFGYYYLTFWEIAKIFNSCIILYAHQQCMWFQLLHILTNTCYIFSYCFQWTVLIFEVVSYYGFDLPFSNEECCCAFSYVFFGHLYIFIRKVYIHVLCPSCNWVIYFLLLVTFIFWIQNVYQIYNL